MKRKTRPSKYTRLIKKQYLELENLEKGFLAPLQKRYDQVEKAFETEKDPLVLDELAVMKMLLSTRIALEERTQIFLLIHLVTSGRVDKLQRKNGGLTTREQAAEDKFDKHVAKRLSELLDMKGHEGMYDTGTKPSRSN